MSIRSNDHALVCSFTFADGRRCRMPRRNDHPHLCPFHARKEAQALAGEQAGQDIAYFLSGAYLSACDLSSALGRLFAAVAQGQIKPKTAATLAYLGQTLVQTLHLAQHEYINAFGAQNWREAVRNSYQESADRTALEPEPEPDPESEPEPEREPALAKEPGPVSTQAPPSAPANRLLPDSVPARPTYPSNLLR